MVAIDNDNNALTALFTKLGRIQFIILSLICLGVIFFGQPFITMWAGENYSGAYPILLLLIIPVTIPLIQNIGIEIQKAKNMHKFRSVVYLLIAIGNVFISIPLARLYGGVGTALGTAIALIIGNGFIMNWYYHKRIGLDIIFFWKQILKFFPSLVPPILFGIFINQVVNLNHLSPFLLSGTIYVLIFGISMWLLGMNAYEKDLLGKPILRALKKLKNSLVKE